MTRLKNLADYGLLRERWSAGIGMTSRSGRTSNGSDDDERGRDEDEAGGFRRARHGPDDPEPIERQERTLGVVEARSIAMMSVSIEHTQGQDEGNEPQQCCEDEH